MPTEPKPTEPTKCPKCGSTNLDRYEKGFTCKDCGYVEYPERPPKSTDW
jgi:ribosomal protein S27AE